MEEGEASGEPGRGVWTWLPGSRGKELREGSMGSVRWQQDLARQACTLQSPLLSTLSLLHLESLGSPAVPLCVPASFLSALAL